MKLDNNFGSFASDIALSKAQNALGNALSGGFGEIFLEKSAVQGLVFDQGRLQNNQIRRTEGVGARRVFGSETTYAHVETLSDVAIATAVQALGLGKGVMPAKPQKLTHSGFYHASDIPPLETRLATIIEIDKTIRALDARIVNVTITLASAQQNIAIIHAEGDPMMDARPMSRIGIAVTIDENGRRESGNAGKGGRYDIRALMVQDCWLALGKEALRIALVNVTARPCPAGEQTLLLGPGWPGVLFHEAVGHGLEGDFNRRKSSAFSGLMGKQVAAKGVCVVDDGTIAKARGSIHFDDEGRSTQRTTLIEDGVLVGYMQDRLNAELMGQESTGNCRRESYAHPPMPRMTNTFLDNGQDDPKDLLADMGDGIYAVGFGGGQVDITSGKFVFNCTEAYRVEGGKVQYPVKGATLIGDGPTALQKITGIGNDLSLDPGVGNCGKAGQWVPVCVGQPSVLMEGITIGGTEIG